MLYQHDLFGVKPTEKSWVLPELHGNTVALDTETTGLNVFTDKPIGIVVRDAYMSYYIPIQHGQGFNHDKEKVLRWAKDQLTGKDVLFAEAKFDIRMLRNYGIDLESLSVKPHDIQHQLALLDSKRRSYSLENMGLDFLDTPKLEWDHSKNATCLPEEIEEYALRDTDLTWELFELFDEQITQQDLGRVLELEDSIIYPVLEMEQNGLPIDEEKLAVWQKKATSRYVKNILALTELVGFRVEPSKPIMMAKFFHKVGIEYKLTKQGKAQIDEDTLKKYAIEYPEAMAPIMGALALKSIKDKFLDKYPKLIRDGKLYTKLNQLKSDDYGTVTGRFSSSGDKVYGGINVQQVPKKDNLDEIVSDFLIRDLFLPEDGYDWCSADAKQIEFRLFVYYSESEALLRKYAQDPLIDAHTMIAHMCEIDRYHAKRINFGILYGMGINKLANTLGVSVSKARQLIDTYHAKFPEAKKLLNLASDRAERRGWVKTILGRRRRYDKGEPTHSALNAVIQGTAADINREIIRRVYEERKYIGYHKLRSTVHDEINLDIPKNSGVDKRLKEVLERPPLGIEVPAILWDVAVGPTWERAE